jgi:hypothetical protein
LLGGVRQVNSESCQTLPKLDDRQLVHQLRAWLSAVSSSPSGQ